MWKAIKRLPKTAKDWKVLMLPYALLQRTSGLVMAILNGASFI